MDRMAGASADDGRQGSGVMEPGEGGDRDVKPLLVEIGVAVALSFAGFFGFQLRHRSRRPPLRQPSLWTSSPEESTGVVSQNGLKDIGGGLRDGLSILNSEEASVKIVNGTSITAGGSEDKPGLPELNDSLTKDSEVSTRPRVKEETAMKQETTSRKELVLSLKENEETLELQLLDHNRAKEQEAAVRELEKRLKLSAIETELYNLKMESLKAENQRLQAQLVEYSGMMNDLEAARAKIASLEMKLKSDGEKKEVLLASFEEKNIFLQRKEQKDVESLQELETKLKRLEELEAEAVELKTANLRLAEENSLLVMKLGSSEMAKSSVFEDTKLDSLEEAQHLREMNEKLKEEIEQLQTDRCADVEELVYLRWLNACLRYELRTYHPSAGKTVARDLSKSLSMKSEERAKQLILEYANSKSSNLYEDDSEHSSSQITNGESGDTPYDASSSARRNASDKSKLMTKIKKLMLGKGKRRNRVPALDTPTNYEPSESRASISTYPVGDVIGRESYDSSSSSCDDKDVYSKINPRLSLDIQALRRLNLEETREKEGIPHRISSVISDSEKKISILDEIAIEFGQNNQIDQENALFPEKAKIKKLADALAETDNE